MFDTLSAESNLARVEEEVRRFWQWYRLPETARAGRSGGAPLRLLQEPLYAAGQPRSEQAQVFVTADLLARYHTLRGACVTRQTFWNCHGLGVQLEAEAQLPPTAGGYDLDRFNATCRDVAVQGMGATQSWAERLGVWLDPADTLTTLEPRAVSLVWSELRRLWDNGRLKQVQAVVPVCPRCATVLSDDEAQRSAADGTARAVWVCLPWEGEPDTYFLVRTPAPWALVGMVALAARPDAGYVVVECSERPDANPMRLVLAEAALERTIPGPFRLVRRLPDKALRVARYRPLFTFLPAEAAGGRLVWGSETPLVEGTGLEAITPAFDQALYAVASASGLPVPHLLDDWGTLDDSAGHFRGLSPAEAEEQVVDELTRRGLLFRQQTVSRRDALCPYCATALVTKARPVWRAEIGDRTWLVGRDLAWGVPLPVWVCDRCGERTFMAGLDDLAHRIGLDADQIDSQRPMIDRLTFPCPTCGGAARRVSAVVDPDFVAALLPLAGVPRPDPALLAVGSQAWQGWLPAVEAVSRQIAGAPAAERSVPACSAEPLPDWDPAAARLSDALRWAVYRGVSPEDAELSFLRLLWRTGLALADARPPDDGRAPAGAGELLGRWLLASLHQTLISVTGALDDGKPAGAAAEVAAWLDAVSRWIPVVHPGAAAAALPTLTRMVAPFVPHLAEALHRRAGGRTSESIHLTRWPAPDVTWENPALIAAMAQLRRLAALASGARATGGLDPDAILPRAVLGLVGASASEIQTGEAWLELACMALGVGRVELVEGRPAPARWKLSLDPEHATARSVDPAELEAALTALDVAAQDRLVAQVWEGYSVSVTAGSQAFTLLPTEFKIEVSARPGWTTAAAWRYVVAIEHPAPAP